jgi:hypothetical protein
MTSQPKTLEEALVALDEMLCDEDREHLTIFNEVEAATELHHSLGRHLRNVWGLWQGSALAQNLKSEHGITHPDGMSSYIIKAYCRRGVLTRFQRILSIEDLVVDGPVLP